MRSNKPIAAGLIAVLLLAAGLVIYLGWDNGSIIRSKPISQIKSIRMLTASLTETFNKGKAEEVTQGVRPGESRPDSRVVIVAMFLDKLRSNIDRRTDDPARQAALVRLQAVQKAYKEEFLPKFAEAQASRKPEHAKALVPYMATLDRQMNEVAEALQ